MPDEIIGVKLQVDKGNSTETVKSFRTQLREATAELIKIQEQFGDISPEAQKAAKGVAELRDRIKDASEVAELFNPEKKLQAVEGAAQGILAGFTAVQGAMALVGGESKEVEAAILRVQAAMALAQGLSGLRASVEDFQRLRGVLANLTIVQRANAAANTVAAGTMRLFGVATTQTGVAFNVLKGAIAATGIGLLIVGVGALVSKLMELTSSTNEATEAQKKLNAEIAAQANQFSDDIVEIYEKDAQLRIARAKAAGQSEAEIAEITRQSNEKIRQERFATYNDLLTQGKDASAAKKALDKADTDSEIFELGLRQKAREEAEKAAKDAQSKSKADGDKAAAARKAAADAAKQIEQQTADEVFAIQHTAGETELHALAEKFRLRLEAYRKDGRDTSDLIVAWAIERGAIEKKYADEQLAADKEAAEKRKQVNADYIDSVIQQQDLQTESEHQHAVARKQIAESEKESKIKAAQAGAQILGELADLAGEQTAAGKVLAITAATISMYASAQQAYWAAFNPVPTYASPFLGALYAAGAIAVGLNNIRKIASVPVPGQGSGGASVPGAGGAAPLSPQGATPQSVKIDQQGVNNTGNATIKAVVVESDITDTQQRIQRIQTAATFK